MQNGEIYIYAVCVGRDLVAVLCVAQIIRTYDGSRVRTGGRPLPCWDRE